MKTIMKTMQVETTHTPKPRRYRLWAGCFILLLGSPILLYYGYCSGLWGRHSLLLQYFFQCSCPPASEEWRYPKRVDVIVSACRQSYVELSPSGRFLQVKEEKSGLASTYYLLDLQTMERTDLTNRRFSSFLTDDLGFIESGLEDYIVDRNTGKQYPIQTFRYWRENAYVNGEPDLELLVAALHQAEQVFFTQRSNDTVIVLMPNFRTNPEQSFAFSRSDIRRGDFNNRVEQFLQANNISYQTVRADFPGESVSLDGRFVARADGIYLVETGKKVVEGYSTSRFNLLHSRNYFTVRGWISDGSGVIYSKFLNPCLIEPPGLDGPGCFYEVPQPAIILKVPEKYLLPTQMP